MSKLRATDFKPEPFVSITDEPNFEGVEGKRLSDKKIEDAPAKVRDAFEAAKAEGKNPALWKLNVKAKDKTAYALVTEKNISENEVAVMSKKGHSIVTIRMANFDSLDD